MTVLEGLTTDAYGGGCSGQIGKTERYENWNAPCCQFPHIWSSLAASRLRIAMMFPAAFQVPAWNTRSVVFTQAWMPDAGRSSTGTCRDSQRPRYSQRSPAKIQSLAPMASHHSGWPTGAWDP